MGCAGYLPAFKRDLQLDLEVSILHSTADIPVWGSLPSRAQAAYRRSTDSSPLEELHQLGGGIGRTLAAVRCEWRRLLNADGVAGVRVWVWTEMRQQNPHLIANDKHEAAGQCTQHRHSQTP